MSPDLPPTIDPIAAARWQTAGPLASPWLHEEVARRMESRLDWIKREPGRWAHWAPVLGGMSTHESIARRYPGAECFVVEEPGARTQAAASVLARRWWQPARWHGGQPRFVAPAAASVQLLWSNMGLHMAADPQWLIGRWHEAIADDGFLMFSCLGPDSVRELRMVYRSLGWGEAGHAFTDMHDWGDMLLQAGFAEPVMDMERITLTYTTAARLLAELRELGRNLHPDRFPGLRTPRWRKRLESGLEQRLPRATEPDRLSITFEVIYGHAFKAPPRVAVADTSTIALDDMRQLLKMRRGGAASKAVVSDDSTR